MTSHFQLSFSCIVCSTISCQQIWAKENPLSNLFILHKSSLKLSLQNHHFLSFSNCISVSVLVGPPGRLLDKASCYACSCMVPLFLLVFFFVKQCAINCDSTNLLLGFAVNKRNLPPKFQYLTWLVKTENPLIFGLLT